MYRIAMCNKVNKMINLWSFDLKNVMNTIHTNNEDHINPSRIRIIRVRTSTQRGWTKLQIKNLQIIRLNSHWS